MQPTRIRFCCVGAVVSSVSWMCVLFIYLNMSRENQKITSQSNAFSHYAHLKHFNKKHSFHKLQSNFNFINSHRKSKLKDDQSMLKVHQGPTLVSEGPYIEPNDAGKINSKTDQEEYAAGKKRHSFNEFLSNKLSFHRPIPDTRDERCVSKEYSTESLPRASIVICFYNEALSTLLRSIHSIIDRTAANLIEEIILVDDCSNDPSLKKALSDYVRDTFGATVKISRNSQREGLIRSRMIGARLAKAKVLIFLDSHIEVNRGWLEPLLVRVSESTSSIVVPVIDIIDADTFEYKASPLVRGGFTWSMRFSWEPVPPAVLSSNPFYIYSPTMAGGLLAVNKEYFFHLGGYDEGMDLWGGENLEMSFRVWMCGGMIEIAICSRVGHIFRNSRPYSSPDGENTWLKNTLRTVNVWLGPDKERFYKANGDNYDLIAYGDVGDRDKLKKSLNCNEFKWYLENVYSPSNRIPIKKNEPFPKGQAGAPLSKGKIKHANSGLCMLPADTDKTISPSHLYLMDCSITRAKWYELPDGAWRINKKYCLDVLHTEAAVRKCTGAGGTQKWKLLPLEGSTNLVMYSVGTGLCIAVNSLAAENTKLQMASCDKAATFTYNSK